MEKVYEIIGVVKGCHYVLSHGIKPLNEEEAIAGMVSWKNQHNESREHPYSITAKVGETIDVIRVDTIEKMYIRVKFNPNK